MAPVNPDTAGSPHQLDPDTIAAVRQALSQARLGPYLEASAGDLVRALELYDWNGIVAGAAFGVLEVLEILVRNAFNAALIDTYGPDWWRPDARTFLQGGSLQQAEEAVQRFEGPRVRLSTDKFVSESSFGFWTSLVARRYDQQWRDAVHRAFAATPPARKQVQKQMYRLNKLRNRIAHHEAIWSRDLARFRSDATHLLRGVAPDADAWYQPRLERLDDVLESRPPWTPG